MGPGAGAVPPAPGSGSAPGAAGNGGGPEDILKLLASLQQSPSPSGEEKMLFEATTMINGAYARVATRNSKVGKLLMDANSKVNQALEALKGENGKPMSAPPDMGMPPTGAAPGPIGPVGP